MLLCERIRIYLYIQRSSSGVVHDFARKHRKGSALLKCPSPNFNPDERSKNSEFGKS